MFKRSAEVSRPGTRLFESVGQLAGLFAIFLGTVLLLLSEQYWLLLLSGLSVLGALLFLRHPRWLYLLIIALIPFWGLRSIYGINVQWALGMALLLILLFSSVPRKRLPTQLASNFWHPFALLLFIFVLSSWQSAFPDTAWHETFLLLSAYLYIGLGFVYIDRAIFTTLLPRIILLTVSFGSAVVVLEYIFDLPYIPADPRGFGLSNNTNNVAKMAIFTLPLIVHGLLYQRIFRRGVLLVLLLLNLAAVITTFSRSGFLILLITLLVLAYQYRSQIRPMRFGPALVILTVITSTTIASVPQSFWERQMSLLEFNDSSLKRRVAYLQIGWESFLQAPLLGSGPGTFKDMYSWSPRAAEFISESGSDRRYQLRETKTRRHAHNGYLEILVGSGIVGLLVYLSILAMTLRRFGSAIRQFKAADNGEMASLSAAYGISYIALLLYLAVGSLVFHKYLLLTIAISEVARRLAGSRAQGGG
jgi:putative inorganic carbon (HCO3(-)) transporter